MFQRQELKGSLARTLGFNSTSNASSGGSSSGSATFSQTELRDLFSYVKKTNCDTADRIKAMKGETPEHWTRDASETTTDVLLAYALRDKQDISFVCQLPSLCTSTDTEGENDNGKQKYDDKDRDEKATDW
jgi:DNA repair and recombination protein RAD54B